MTDEAERQILEQAHDGDPDAFTVLVERYTARIYGTCFNLLGNRQDTEDCVQDTFIKAYRSIHNYNRLSSFYTWLYRIAINACLDFRRKKQKLSTFSLDEAMETEDSQVFMQVPDLSPLPDELVETAETREIVRQEINQLPDYLREILVLRDLEGLSYQELAQILHLTEGTVKSRLSRARQQLMDRIRRREQLPAPSRLKDKSE